MILNCGLLIQQIVFTLPSFCKVQKISPIVGCKLLIQFHKLVACDRSSVSVISCFVSITVEVVT